jgi:hypothetical protein
MKTALALISALLLTGMVLNCSGHKRYHDSALGDPAAYKAHFPDIDAGGDDLVSWEEFKAYFPDSDPHVFKALDLNKDSAVDHDEWHKFKEAHGLKDHD